MSGLWFLAALTLLPVLGWCAAPLLFWHARSRRGGLALLSALGMVALTLAMLLQTWVRVPWTIVGLIAPFFLVRVLLAWRREPKGPLRGWVPPRAAIPGLVVAGLGLVLCAYVAGSGRATSDDLLLFWGPKGQHFAQAAGSDPAYLTSRSQFVLRPDYPPLVPFLYAWGALFAGRLPWLAAVLTLPLCVLLSALSFWNAAREAIPARQAAEGTLLLVTLLAFPLGVSLCAGNGEPPLLFFEVLALSALTFLPAERSSLLVASLGLAGAALTKVEGAAFAGLVVLVYGGWQFLRTRSLRPALLLASLPAASLGLWVAYAHGHGMVESYGGQPNGPFTLRFARTVFKGILANADYHSAYAPWIVVAVITIFGARHRAWRAPALVAAGYFGFIVYCYLHGGEMDPSLWISWTAPRLLLTPLVCLFFAATAPGRESEKIEP